MVRRTPVIIMAPHGATWYTTSVVNAIPTRPRNWLPGFIDGSFRCLLIVNAVHELPHGATKRGERFDDQVVERTEPEFEGILRCSRRWPPPTVGTIVQGILSLS